MRVTTAFNMLLALPGVNVTAVEFADDRVLVDVRLRRRRLACPHCQFTTAPGTTCSVPRWKRRSTFLTECPLPMSTALSAFGSSVVSICFYGASGPTSMSSTSRIRLVAMGSVPEATITLGEAASRLGTTVDALLELIYKGGSLQRQTRLRGGCS